MRLIVIEAKYGDCLLLEWTDKPGSNRYILIDGGPNRTFDKRLSPTFAELGVKQLDLVINSHIDTDHINGLLEYFSTIAEKRAKNKDAAAYATPSIIELWHNQFAKTLDKSGAITASLQSLAADAAASIPGTAAAEGDFLLQGVAQGNQLLALAKKLKIPVNASNDGLPLLVEKIGREPAEFTFKGDLRMIVVGPSEGNLEKLRKSWESYLAKHKKKPAARVRDSDTAAMVDSSVPNLSSIQLYVWHNGRTMLLTGDGRGDHLLEGLDEQGLLDAKGGIDVDVLKVPHHGSDRDADQAFFEKVRAKKYVISADGRYDNPSEDVLEWILAAAKKQSRKVEIVLTNRPTVVEKFEARLRPSDPCKVIVREDDAHWIGV